MNPDDLKSVLANEPKYRLTQAFQFVYGKFIRGWDEALSLPKELRERLEIECPLEINAKIYTSDRDKTQKALIKLEDSSEIETVLMRHSDNHNTVCVSCQVGCGMNCAFCATGKMGFKRNLAVHEIITQVLVFARILIKKNRRISNIVFMGMGEPLANYENVMSAVKILNDPETFNISARKISISTCGLVAGIEKLAREPMQINLAVSLHAPTDDLRQSIMPINKQYNIEKILSAVRAYIEKTNRKVMIEYVLLNGINDNVSHAKKLADILKTHLKHLFMVNLIVYNSTMGKFRAPSQKTIADFRQTLESSGITVTQRFRLGHDIEGACGQLATNTAKTS